MSPQDILSYHEILTSLFRKAPNHEIKGREFIYIYRHHGNMMMDKYSQHRFFSSDSSDPVWIWIARTLDIIGCRYDNGLGVSGHMDAMLRGYKIFIKEQVRVWSSLDEISIS